MDKMMEALDKLDGTNSHLQTKDDLRVNLETVTAVSTVLKALALGIEVKLDGRFIVMVEGRLYIKGVSYNTGTQESSDSFMGYGNQITYDQLMDTITKAAVEDPEWLPRIKAEGAMKIVLNDLDKRKKWSGVGD